jgi:hypothetical protein
MDPADLVGKGQKLQDWVHSKMPNVSIVGYSLPKPKFAPPNPFDKNKSNEEKLERRLRSWRLISLKQRL